MVEDAITLPLASVERMALEMPVNQVVPSVLSEVEALDMLSRREKVEEAPEKTLDPLKMLLSERSEEEAAVMVKVPPAVIEVELMVAKEPVR